MNDTMHSRVKLYQWNKIRGDRLALHQLPVNKALPYFPKGRCLLSRVHIVVEAQIPLRLHEEPMHRNGHHLARQLHLLGHLRKISLPSRLKSKDFTKCSALTRRTFSKNTNARSLVSLISDRLLATIAATRRSRRRLLRLHMVEKDSLHFALSAM
mmetsp:Transcript_23867/g.67112  ORF Transcript_23867/g.67112 Transcript_23867/m.67112 type:complete len:155 (-) Transcript_23867:24-488(-)